MEMEEKDWGQEGNFFLFSISFRFLIFLETRSHFFPHLQIPCGYLAVIVLAIYKSTGITGDA